jgi:hypothetical protein
MKLVRKATQGERDRRNGLPDQYDADHNDAETQFNGAILSGVFWVVSALAIVIIFASLGSYAGDWTHVGWVHQASPFVGGVVGVAASFLVERTLGLRKFGLFAISIVSAVVAYRIWKG